MKPFDECPGCGGELVEKEVEKLLKGGVNMAVVKVKAEICLQCGLRQYPEATVRRFELIRQKPVNGRCGRIPAHGADVSGCLKRNVTRLFDCPM